MIKLTPINLFFPEVVYTKILDYISDDELNSLNKVIQNLDYASIEDLIENESVSSQSKNLHLFNLPEFKNIADVIKKEFYAFKNNTLKYIYNDFVYTTSWATKTKPKQQSEYHNHNNCMYSGIFYTNVSPSSGKLLLNKMSTSGFALKPSEYTEFNSKIIPIPTFNKMVIFFPSNLHHKIAYNKSNLTRYSIAFNFLPVNKLGINDSELMLNI